jgi:outer membrane murein-binding lipoprotein Lpp
MNKLSICIALTGAALLSGCASQTGWTPTVDTYNDPRASRLNQDMQECQQLAAQASGGTAKEAAIGGGVGAVAGAAGGAMLGAIAGNAGTGAALGAVVGGLGGAGQQGLESDKRYKSAYNNCLSGRGHRVIR